MRRRLIITPTVEAGSITHGRRSIPYAGALLQDEGFNIQTDGLHDTVRSAVEEIAETVVWCLGREWRDDL